MQSTALHGARVITEETNISFVWFNILYWAADIAELHSSPKCCAVELWHTVQLARSSCEKKNDNKVCQMRVKTQEFKYWKQ